MSEDAYGKMARFTGDARDFGQGQELYVEMPADLDQFGGDYSHGTIVGGEGLVQLGHDPADRWPVFQKMNEEA